MAGAESHYLSRITFRHWMWTFPSFKNFVGKNELLTADARESGELYDFQFKPRDMVLTVTAWSEGAKDPAENFVIKIRAVDDDYNVHKTVPIVFGQECIVRNLLGGTSVDDLQDESFQLEILVRRTRVEPAAPRRSNERRPQNDQRVPQADAENFLDDSMNSTDGHLHQNPRNSRQHPQQAHIPPQHRDQNPRRHIADRTISILEEMDVELGGRSVARGGRQVRAAPHTYIRTETVVINHNHTTTTTTTHHHHHHYHYPREPRQ